MRRVQIGFWDTDSVLEFLKITGSSNCALDLACGSYMVDAKSLLAVFSLRSAKNVELIIHEDSCDDLLKRLDCFIEHGKLLNQNRAV